MVLTFCQHTKLASAIGTWWRGMLDVQSHLGIDLSDVHVQPLNELRSHIILKSSVAEARLGRICSTAGNRTEGERANLTAEHSVDVRKASADH